MPRPRFSDITKAVAVQVVMLSGTVRGISVDTELLQNKTKNSALQIKAEKLHFVNPHNGDRGQMCHKISCRLRVEQHYYIALVSFERLSL